VCHLNGDGGSIFVGSPKTKRKGESYIHVGVSHLNGMVAFSNRIIFIVVGFSNSHLSVVQPLKHVLMCGPYVSVSYFSMYQMQQRPRQVRAIAPEEFSFGEAPRAWSSSRIESYFSGGKTQALDFLGCT
jgi:hypothetical protein